MMPAINPVWGTVLNTLAGIFGIVEGSGLTNVLGGTKYGWIVAVLAGVNAGLHAVSAPVPGPLAK